MLPRTQVSTIVAQVLNGRSLPTLGTHRPVLKPAHLRVTSAQSSKRCDARSLTGSHLWVVLIYVSAVTNYAIKDIFNKYLFLFHKMCAFVVAHDLIQSSLSTIIGKTLDDFSMIKKNIPSLFQPNLMYQ